MSTVTLQALACRSALEAGDASSNPSRNTSRRLLRPMCSIDIQLKSRLRKYQLQDCCVLAENAISLAKPLTSGEDDRWEASRALPAVAAYWHSQLLRSARASTKGGASESSSWHDLDHAPSVQRTAKMLIG